MIRAANVYLDGRRPWAQRRTDQPRMAAVLRVLADTLRAVATVLQPFMPARWDGCWIRSECRRRRGTGRARHAAR